MSLVDTVEVLILNFNQLFWMDVRKGLHLVDYYLFVN